MRTVIEEDMVCRYLLGDLPEADQHTLEQAFFADGKAFERVWEIENQLVDRYVRGRLSAHDTVLFEQNYLDSPVHRERVAFARNLVGAVDSGAEGGAAHSITPPQSSRWSSFLASFRRDSWRWAMIPAMLVLAVAVAGLFSERSRLQNQIRQLNDERASERQRAQELEKEVAAEREKSDELATALERLREDSPTAEHPAQTQPGQNPVRAVVSFLLSPLLVRTGGEAQQVRIATDTQTILLQMKVKSSGVRMFQVELRTVEGTEVWSRTSIKSRPQANDGALVSVAIPASKLIAGDYILTLSGTRGATETEEINRYFFKVVKQ